MRCSSINQKFKKIMRTLKERTRWIINYVSNKEGLSNAKMGKKLGIKGDTVNSYRSMAADPKVEFVVRFCDIFGVDLSWFMKGTGEPFPGARSKFPEVCGPEPDTVQINSTTQMGSAIEDEEGLWGKTKTHTVDGEQINVTLFEPKEAEDPFAQAVSALRTIFDFDDPMIRSAIVANVKIFQLTVSIIRRYKSMEQRMEAVEKVLKKHAPPEGTEERRRSWIEMKKAIGLD